MAMVVPARQEHVEDVRRIADQLFDQLKGYGELIPKFFSTQGVATYVARIGSEVVGFIMLGFLPWSATGRSSDRWIGELLAVAVEPGRQRQGIGSSLMHQALELAGKMSEWREVEEIQLVCAESNQAALRFFARHGFSIVRRQAGSYSSGQSAVQLTRKLHLG